MEKLFTVREIVKALDAEMDIYPGPGPGLKKYRKKDSDGTYSLVGPVWVDIPLRYVWSLTDLTKSDLERIHRIDKQGSIRVGRYSSEVEYVTLILFGSRY